MKKDIANRITLKRTEKGWNKSQLASALGISSAAVGQYELGNTYPKIAILFKLKEIFNWDFINDKPIVENDLNEDNRDVTEINSQLPGRLSQPNKDKLHSGLGYGTVHDKDEIIDHMTKVLEGHQDQIIQLLSTSRLIKDQLQLLKNL